MAILLLVRRGEAKSEKALRLLSENAFEVDIMNADDPSVAPYLMQEFGTAVTPALVTEHGVLPGLDLIRGFIESTRRK